MLHCGKELLIRLTICLLCIVPFVILAESQFGFEGGTVALIVPVPDHCLLFIVWISEPYCLIP